MADIYTLTELVRSRLRLPEAPEVDEAVALHADEAVRESIRRAARRADLRPYTLSDPATVTAELDADGIADLAGIVDAAPRVLLDVLCYGDITHAAYTHPLRPLGQQGFAASLDALFPKYWLKGKLLYTRAGDSPLSGEIGLRVPVWMTLADFPAALVETAGAGLVDVLIEMSGLAPKMMGARTHEQMNRRREEHENQ